MEALIADANDEETSRGETGELLIKSPTHMVGYWRQPDLTAACTHYRSGPSGTDERWHRTGDLAYQDQSGLLRLVGRKDRMVKSRGHRIELDEIEAALVSHAAVDQAVVYAVPDGEGSQQIQAAVILREAGPDGAELKQHVAASLPRYAVPRVLEVVESVPRTSSGKPDRVALAAQALSHSSAAPSRQYESKK
jgi:acyl-CoA synthetase (AMP-forming)/AMP-acid ligase II